MYRAGLVREDLVTQAWDQLTRFGMLFTFKGVIIRFIFISISTGHLSKLGEHDSATFWYCESAIWVSRYDILRKYKNKNAPVGTNNLNGGAYRIRTDDLFHAMEAR